MRRSAVSTDVVDCRFTIVRVAADDPMLDSARHDNDAPAFPA
jgi:hypothetical protein